LAGRPRRPARRGCAEMRSARRRSCRCPRPPSSAAPGRWGSGCRRAPGAAASRWRRPWSRSGRGSHRPG
jgi:hypothetical protein